MTNSQVLNGKMSPSRLKLLFVLLGVGMSSASLGYDPLEPNFCYCTIDPFLYGVMKIHMTPDLKGNQVVVQYVYHPPPSTTTAATTTTDTTASTESTADSSSSTTQAPSRRRKRSTSALLPEETYFGNYSLGVATPTGGVAYDNEVRIAKVLGVELSNNLQTKNCSCTPGGIVGISVCLLNLKWEEAFATPASSTSRTHVDKILPWFDKTLKKALITSDLYYRVRFVSFTKYGDYGNLTQINLEADLSKVKYQLEYDVLNAIEPSLRSGRIGSYTTSSEDCLSTSDKSPKAPANVDPILTLISFAAAGVALGCLVLIVLCVCCGKKDKFYVRFW